MSTSLLSALKNLYLSIMVVGVAVGPIHSSGISMFGSLSIHRLASPLCAGPFAIGTVGWEGHLLICLCISFALSHAAVLCCIIWFDAH